MNARATAGFRPLFERPRVVILGGEVAGAATALHLALRIPPGDAEIVVVEPRDRIGYGLAYSTEDPAHRINVPAGRMSLRRDDPEHFLRWLADANVRMSPGTLTLDGQFFPQRRIFGDYVSSQIDPLLRDGRIRHVQAWALGARREGAGWRVALSGDGALQADVLVLAMTHPCPDIPPGLRELAGSPRVIADPYRHGLDSVGPDDRLLIVGAGLTSADIVASLDHRGFWGSVKVLSRRGLRSRGYQPREASADPDDTPLSAPTAHAVLRNIRRQIAGDAAKGIGWRRTIDRARDQGQAIWGGLPHAERRRLVQHLRPFWDAHRFRLPPQVDEVVERRRKAGALTHLAARLVSAEEDADGGIVVSYRLRGSSSPISEKFDRVLIATGPAHARIIDSNPVLQDLAQAGALQSDPVGLGIQVVATPGPESLFVAGPLARGEIGELMGVPEVNGHCELLADRLFSQVQRLAPTPASARTGAEVKSSRASDLR